MRAVFLDRDGTISVGTPTYERVDAVYKVELLPHSLEALTLLASLDFGVFIVTNQASIAEGAITMEQFDEIHATLLRFIEPSGVKILKTYICPHGEDSPCDCRKPKPTLLLKAAREFGVELSNSWMIGDRVTDVQTGVNAGT